MHTKTLLSFAVFALIGAFLTVGVAWTLATRGEAQERASYQVTIRPDGTLLPVSWLCRRATSSGLDQIAFVGAGGFGVGQAQSPRSGERFAGWPAWAQLPEPKQFSDETVIHVGAGWPARSLRARCVDRDVRWRFVAQGRQADGLARLSGLTATKPGPVWEHAIVVEDHTTGGPFTARVLPMAPIAVGFAVDTVFWGGASYAIFAGATAAAGWVRRRRRRHEGRCPTCDYDLKGMLRAGCPECGWKR